MRACDHYGMRCWQCQGEVEIPAMPVDRAGYGDCPKCGARLESEWLEARAEANAGRPAWEQAA